MLRRGKSFGFEIADDAIKQNETAMQGFELVLVESDQPTLEQLGQLRAHRASGFTPGFRQLQVDAAAVARLGNATDIPPALQAIDQTGNDGRGHHQAAGQLTRGRAFVLDDIECAELAQAQLAGDPLLQHRRLRPAIEPGNDIKRLPGDIFSNFSLHRLAH